MSECLASALGTSSASEGTQRFGTVGMQGASPLLGVTRASPRAGARGGALAKSLRDFPQKLTDCPQNPQALGCCETAVRNVISGRVYGWVPNDKESIARIIAEVARVKGEGKSGDCGVKQ